MRTDLDVLCVQLSKRSAFWAPFHVSRATVRSNSQIMKRYSGEHPQASNSGVLLEEGPTSLWLCRLGGQKQEPQVPQYFLFGDWSVESKRSAGRPNTSNVCASAAVEVSCPAMVKHPLRAVSTAKCCRCATPSLSSSAVFCACSIAKQLWRRNRRPRSAFTLMG